MPRHGSGPDLVRFATFSFVLCGTFFAFVLASSAQQTTPPKHVGLPQDWSQGHILFSRNGLAQHPDLIDREPRIRREVAQRWQIPHFGTFVGAAKDLSRTPAHKRKTGFERDWNVTLGGHLGTNIFPAKYSFDPSLDPDCDNDFVVYGLANVSAIEEGGGHPNLVAFNNLYVDPSGDDGFCEGTAPSVLFAYNITTVTGGHITTSPILSLDGTKIGFIESVPNNSGLGITAQTIFHVLTWNAEDGGTLASGVPPSSITSIIVSPTAQDSKSSPWIDYGTDTVYVGTDDGNIYQITGVFNGTPTLSGDPWPVLVSTNLHLSPPVLDSQLEQLLVGSANGNLYRVDIHSGALGALPLGGVGGGSGIVAAPIVDVTNGTTFAVTANNGTSGALVQVRTATMIAMSIAGIGLGATTPSGGGTATTMNLYEPAVSNDYFTDPDTGVIRICGTGANDTTPWQYAFGFTDGFMNTTNIDSFPVPLITTSPNARCTGWTEFFNPNIGDGGTDWFFFGLTADCTETGLGVSDGCVAESHDLSTDTAQFTISGGPSGIVVDNYSAQPQASSLYFTAERQQTAYKVTQNGLN